MPQFRLPFISRALGVTFEQIDENPPDFTFTIASKATVESDPVDVKGRVTKTVVINSTQDLTGYLYIVPDKEMPETTWILYKTLTITVLANTPFVSTVTDAFPYVALKLENKGNADAAVQAWIYAQ